MNSVRPNYWKYSTLALAAALAFTSGAGALAQAEAAGPRRLAAALASLHACKRHLEDAKDPPANFHHQSLSAVSQAILAVEKEIKAHEDGSGKKPSKDAKDSKEKDRDRDSKNADKKSKETGVEKSTKKPARSANEDGE